MPPASTRRSLPPSFLDGQNKLPFKCSIFLLSLTTGVSCKTCCRLRESARIYPSRHSCWCYNSTVCAVRLTASSSQRSSNCRSCLLTCIFFHAGAGKRVVGNINRYLWYCICVFTCHYSFFLVTRAVFYVFSGASHCCYYCWALQWYQYSFWFSYGAFFLSLLENLPLPVCLIGWFVSALSTWPHHTTTPGFLPLSFCSFLISVG